MKTIAPIYACLECGSTDVQAEMWVNLNGGHVVETVEGGQNYCPRCEDFVVVQFGYVEEETK